MIRVTAVFIGIVCALVAMAASSVQAQDPLESRKFYRIKIHNPAFSPVDVAIVGRRRNVIDRVTVPGGTTVPTSDPHMWGGWRVVCWWQSRHPENGVQTRTIRIDRNDMTIELRPD